jgi:hypothetical protein
MKTNTALTAAALLGLAILVGAAASEPSRAQEGAPGYGYGGGEWQAAGSYTTAEGGDVWMINTRTGAARNCYWRRAHPTATPELGCAQAQ